MILVLLRHAAHLGWDQSAPLAPILGLDAGTFMLNGWIGVDLFFVLSGFLISHHIIKLNERHEGHWPWRLYLAKRGLRIVPAYYAVLFLAALGSFPYYAVSDQLVGFRIGYHMLFLQDYLPANIVVAFWSMGVEEKFYLVAPFLVLACARQDSQARRIALPLAILAGVVVLRVITMYLHLEVTTYEAFFPVFRSPFHMTLDPILLGVTLAFLYRGRAEWPRLTAPHSARLVFWAGVACFIALTTSGDLMGQISWWDKTLQPLAIAVIFAAITFGLLFDGGPSRLFGSTVLLFFARISFSLDLVHLPLVPFAKELAVRQGGAEAGFSVFFVIFISISVVAALLLHYAVEKPFLNMKDRIR